MNYYTYIWPVTVILLLWMHCATDKIAGNSSESGNPTIVGYLYEPQGKMAAAGVEVFIRPKQIPAAFSDNTTSVISKVDSVLTDESGRFAFDSSISQGTYIIEASRDNNAVLIDPVVIVNNDSTVYLPADTLKPSGAIKGIVRLSEGGDPRKTIIRAYGFERSADIGTDGTFIYKGLPEGNYHLLLWSAYDNYGVIDTQNISVESSDTTDIGIIELPFTGIPTVKNPRIVYDTLQQQVILYWNKPDNGLASSYNIYRRVVDQSNAVFIQLNMRPVIDTSYTDARCEENKTYEYRITAVDSNTNEGKRSTGVAIAITAYNITPTKVSATYDTLRQITTIHWNNPDTSLVTGYNIYRRNIDLGETFRTPLNNYPLTDTLYIDSIFSIYQNSNISNPDSPDFYGPTYEYCIRAVLGNSREGAKSTGALVHVNVKFVTPLEIQAAYDTVKQMVHLCWNIRDTSQLRCYAVFRKNINSGENRMIQLPDVALTHPCFSDSTGEQNKTYEYRIASLLKNERATVVSQKVTVYFTASYDAEEMSFNIENDSWQVHSPCDISISSDDNIYIVDQGSDSVKVFDSNMHSIRQFGSSILSYPQNVAIGNNGFSYVANYDMKCDCYAIFIFDSTGNIIDTISLLSQLTDIDVQNGLMNTLTDDHIVSIYSESGSLQRSWNLNSHDGRCIAGDTNIIVIGAGMPLSNMNRVIIFDIMGNMQSLQMLPYTPVSIAYDNKNRYFYVACSDGIHNSILQVFNCHNVEVARYKIDSNNQNISISLKKNGAVLLALKDQNKIILLKPLFR
ncbi:MAG TPA: hypothetical protein VHO70_24065 [Chitinispirillaceae bacterium]|nr:hypothetical protein [Chitinispirillaceae bacterium]